MPDDDRRVFRALIGVASTAVFVSFGTGYAIMDHEAETHADSGRWTKVRDVLALLDFDLQRWSPGPFVTTYFLETHVSIALCFYLPVLIIVATLALALLLDLFDQFR